MRKVMSKVGRVVAAVALMFAISTVATGCSCMRCHKAPCKEGQTTSAPCPEGCKCAKCKKT